MTKFYFVRHGQTIFNLKGKAQGWCDSPLTDLGISQARRTGEELAGLDFSLVYSSTSERCIDTTKIITANRYPINSSKNLKEFNFGYLEGEDKQDLIKGRQANNLPQVAIEQGWHDVGGEDSKDVYQRVKQLMDFLKVQYPEGKILMVCHWGTILTVVAKNDKKIYEEIITGKIETPRNAQITIIDTWEDQYKVIKYNQINI